MKSIWEENCKFDKREDLTEAEENAIIAREIKQTKETKDSCPADRTDIMEECDARLAVLKEFAPEEMSEEQIKAEIKAVLEELGIDAVVVKEEDIMKIMAYNILSLPALIVDENIVSVGKKLSLAEVKSLLTI